jgi:hypothetical protein
MAIPSAVVGMQSENLNILRLTPSASASVGGTRRRDEVGGS